MGGKPITRCTVSWVLPNILPDAPNRRIGHLIFYSRSRKKHGLFQGDVESHLMLRVSGHHSSLLAFFFRCHSLWILSWGAAKLITQANGRTDGRRRGLRSRR